jgi:LEA14-like dessication related protein
LLLGLLCLLLGACAGPFGTRIEPPDVTLAGMSFARPGLAEQALTVSLRVRNPNAFDVPVNGLSFALALNGADFASGRSAAGFTLPSQSETVVPIEIALPTGDLLSRVAAIGTGRRLDYQLTGQAEVGRLFGLAVPFRREGKLALPAIPGLNAPPAS